VLSFQRLRKLFVSNGSSEHSLDIFTINSQGFGGEFNGFLVLFFLLEVNTSEGSVDEQNNVKFTKLSGWNKEFLGLDFLYLLGGGQEDLNGFGKVFYLKIKVLFLNSRLPWSFCLVNLSI
jgi:hypothetical protein